MYNPEFGTYELYYWIITLYISLQIMIYIKFVWKWMYSIIQELHLILTLESKLMRQMINYKRKFTRLFALKG